MTGCKVKQVPATSFHLFVCTYENAAFNHRSTQHFFPESHLLDNMASIPIAKINILLSLHCLGHLNFMINHEQS